MAELQEAPWAQPVEDDTNHPQAPWAAKKEPPVLPSADVAQTVVPSLERGAIGLLTAPRSISDLAGAGVNWAAQKVAPQPIADAVKKFHESDLGLGTSFPTYDEMKGMVEKNYTGPMYEAKTGPGRIVQTALETAPALAAGGEGVIPTVAKAVGAGFGSEGLGNAAAWLKSKFPDAVPDKAEDVARGVGAMAGTGLPALARRGVTPLPMTDARLATVNALKNVNPELVQESTAGQLTQSPRVAALEGRSPRMADLPDRQASAYTQGVMRQAGSNGMFDTPGLAQAKQTGAQLDALQNAYTMSPAEYALLNQKLRQDYVDLSSHAGYEASKPFFNFKEDVRLGPNRGVPGFPTGRSPLHPTDMPGDRFGVLKKQAQAAAQGAAPSDVETALYGARQDLKDAFQRSMPPDEAARLRELDQQNSNYHTIKDIPAKADQNTITPNQVFGRAPRGSDLESHATNSASVMTPLPEPNTHVSPLVQIGSAVANSLAHGGAGYHYGGAPAGLAGAGEGFLGGLFGAEPAINAVRDAAGRVVAHPAAQAYLKNQLWRPGGASAPPDMATLVRLLAASPQHPAIAGPGK